jgi:hypothetical protein
MAVDDAGEIRVGGGKRLDAALERGLIESGKGTLHRRTIGKIA